MSKELDVKRMITAHYLNLEWHQTRVEQISIDGIEWDLPTSPFMGEDGSGGAVYMAILDKESARYMRDRALELANACANALEMDQSILDDANNIRRVIAEANAQSEREQKKKECKPNKIENGFVYIYTNGDKYKIGKSKSSPEDRMRTAIRAAGVIGKENNYRMILKAYVGDYHSVEKEMHELFPGKRQGNSEWFDLSIDEVQQLIEYVRDDSITIQVDSIGDMEYSNGE